MSDYRAFIEQAKSIHRPIATDRCRRCAGEWPCLTARLADALEQELGVFDALYAEMNGRAQDPGALEVVARHYSGLRAECVRIGAEMRAERDAALARLAQAERERDVAAQSSNAWEANALVYAQNAESLARELGAARLAADAAAAFRAADQERRAHLTGGCVMPDTNDAWVAARDEFRRTADAWAAAIAAREGKP